MSQPALTTDSRSIARRSLRWLVAGGLAALVVGGACSLSFADEAAKVELPSAGRSLPWYDPATDELREINLPAPPKQPTPTNTSSSSQSRSSNPWTINFLGLELSGAQFLGGAFLAILLTAIVIAVVIWFMRTRRGDKPQEEVPEDLPADLVEALPVAVRAKIGDLLTAARELADQGRYNEAIVFLYCHELVELDKNQFIELRPGRTNRQYLAVIRSQPELFAVLRESMIAFEDAYFGGIQIGRARFERCWEQIEPFMLQLSGAPL